MVNGNSQTTVLSAVVLALDEIAHEADDASRRLTDDEDEGPSAEELASIAQGLVSAAVGLLEVVGFELNKAVGGDNS